MSKLFVEMSDNEMAAFITEQVDMVAKGDVPQLEMAYDSFKRAGAVANKNVGVLDMNRRQTMDWYAGQLIEIVEKKALIAVNSYVNMCDKFVKENR